MDPSVEINIEMEERARGGMSPPPPLKIAASIITHTYNPSTALSGVANQKKKDLKLDTSLGYVGRLSKRTTTTKKMEGTYLCNYVNEKDI